MTFFSLMCCFSHIVNNQHLMKNKCFQVVSLIFGKTPGLSWGEKNKSEKWIYPSEKTAGNPEFLSRIIPFGSRIEFQSGFQRVPLGILNFYPASSRWDPTGIPVGIPENPAGNPELLSCIIPVNHFVHKVYYKCFLKVYIYQSEKHFIELLFLFNYQI